MSLEDGEIESDTDNDDSVQQRVPLQPLIPPGDRICEIFRVNPIPAVQSAEVALPRWETRSRLVYIDPVEQIFSDYSEVLDEERSSMKSDSHEDMHSASERENRSMTIKNTRSEQPRSHSDRTRSRKHRNTDKELCASSPSSKDQRKILKELRTFIRKHKKSTRNMKKRETLRRTVSHEELSISHLLTHNQVADSRELCLRDQATSSSNHQQALNILAQDSLAPAASSIDKDSDELCNVLDMLDAHAHLIDVMHITL